MSSISKSKDKQDLEDIIIFYLAAQQELGFEANATTYIIMERLADGAMTIAYLEETIGHYQSLARDIVISDQAMSVNKHTTKNGKQFKAEAL